MRFSILVPAFLLVLVMHVNAQEKVYMPYFEVMNVHADYQYSISKLFKTYVDANGKYEIILPERKDSLQPVESIDQARQHAMEQGSKYFLLGEVNRLGNDVVVSLRMYETVSGEKVWSDVQKIITPLELDKIISLMAHELGKNPLTSGHMKSKSSNTTVLVGHTKNSIEKFYFSFTIGKGYTGYPGISQRDMSGIGVACTYDIRNTLVDLKGHAFFGDMNIYNINMLAYSIVQQTKHAPFFGGGIGYGGCQINKNKYVKVQSGGGYGTRNYYGGNGIVLYAGGGYLINREGNVCLRIGIDAFFSTFQVDGSFPSGALMTATLMLGN